MICITSKKSISKVGLFSLPIIASSLLQQFYTVVDSIIVGRCIGEKGIAAIGVSGSIISFLTFIIFGIGIGMTVLLSKYYGAGNQEKFGEVAETSLTCGLIFSIFISVVCFVFSKQILYLFQVKNEIFQDSKVYLCIMCIGLVFAFLYNFCNSVLLSIGNSRASFFILLYATIINIILTYILTAKLNMGVTGAAIASICSQFFSVVFGVIYIKRRNLSINFNVFKLKVDTDLLFETINYSGASAIQMLLFHGGKLIIQGIINTLEVNVIAGYSVAVQIEAFVLSALEGVATSVSKNCAADLGEGDKDKIREDFFAGIIVSFVYTLLIGTLILIFSSRIVALFVKSGNITELSSGILYLRYMAYFYLAVSIAQILQALYRSIGRMDIAIIATILQMIFRIGITFAFIKLMGVVAICYGTLMGWISMILYEGVLTYRYFKN